MIMQTSKQWAFLLIAIIFIGCGSTTTEQKTENKPTEIELSQDEMKEKTERLISTVIKSEDVGLKLNNGEKWKVNNESLKQVLQVKQQIYVVSGNMENYEIASYNMLGNEILEFVKTIKPLPNSASNIEFQKVISETKSQCAFLSGTNLQGAQVAVVNLSILYDEVPKYFEYEN